MGNDSRPYFEMRDSDGRPAKYYVDFTIGSKWQQAYVTRLPDGRMHVLPIEYNKIHGRWVNYWKSIDPPASVRADLSKFPRLLPATNYQLNCAICHTSQLRAASTQEESIMQARFQEPGIDCEMCHGPSKAARRPDAGGEPEPLEGFDRHRGVGSPGELPEDQQ